MERFDQEVEQSLPEPASDDPKQPLQVQLHRFRLPGILAQSCQEKTYTSAGGRGNLDFDLRPTAWMSARVGSERFPAVAFSVGDNDHDRVRRIWQVRMISAS
jgi:hypothetical protein